MMTVEREIGSIESANINKETLDAMKNASNAIKQIHGGLTVDQVDQTMEDLREQHAVGEEIAEALTQGAGTMGVDEDELDEELAELQQELLDERMLKTGSVPVSDQINRMPSAPSKCFGIKLTKTFRDNMLTQSCSKEHRVSRGGGRGGRAAEIAGRDGYVKEVHLSDRSGGVNIFGSARGILYTLLPCLVSSFRQRCFCHSLCEVESPSYFLTFTNAILPMHYDSSWKWSLTFLTPTKFPQIQKR
jgi:charged multivesicular body protein 4